MKQTMTNIDDPNEISLIINSKLGNYTMDVFFRNLPIDMSPFVQSEN